MKILAYCFDAGITCADHMSDTLAVLSEIDGSEVTACTADDLNPVEYCEAGHNFCGRCGSTDFHRFGFFHACQNCTMTTYAPDNDDQFVVDDVKRLRMPTGEDFVEHDIIIGSFLDRDPNRLRYAYQVVTGKGDDRPVFYGTDFRTPVHHAMEEAVIGLLGFLSLRPGDTDPDYFENYSAAQTAWCDRYAEEVGCLHYDFDLDVEDTFDNVITAYGASWEDFS